MTGPDDAERDVERYERMCREKADAEIAAADAPVVGSGRIRSSGDVLAEIALIKGAPGPHDVAAGRVLSGADGEAATKALDALGLPSERYAVCSRPGRSAAAARARRLALIIEAVDPAIVIALDPEAAADVALAMRTGALVPGEPVSVRGRNVLAIDGLEASLGDERLKKRVWRQLRALAPATPETPSGRP